MQNLLSVHAAYENKETGGQLVYIGRIPLTLKQLYQFIPGNNLAQMARKKLLVKLVLYNALKSRLE